MARMGRFVVPDPRDNVTANRGCVSLTGTAAARRAAFHDGHVPPVARSLSSVPSASGVVTGRLQVWPWQSIAAGSARRGRPSRGRAVRPEAAVEPQHGERRVGRGERDRGERLGGADRRAARRRRRPAALQQIGAHEQERAAAERLGRAGKGADEAFGRLAPARLRRSDARGARKPRPSGRRRRASRRHARGGAARRARRRRRAAVRKRPPSPSPNSSSASLASRPRSVRDRRGSPVASNSASAARAIAA